MQLHNLPLTIVCKRQLCQSSLLFIRRSDTSSCGPIIHLCMRTIVRFVNFEQRIKNIAGVSSGSSILCTDRLTSVMELTSLRKTPF